MGGARSCLDARNPASFASAKSGRIVYCFRQAFLRSMPPRRWRDARASGRDFRYAVPRLFLEGDAFHATRRCLASNKDFTDSSAAAGLFPNAYQVNSGIERLPARASRGQR